jgi:hypothetical protein
VPRTGMGCLSRAHESAMTASRACDMRL